MARFTEPTPEQEQRWLDWVASRPDVVRKIAERFEPWSLYIMKSTGQRVTVYSFSEDGTMTVNITGRFNSVMFDRQVFGINPDDLEPCNMPAENEIVGAALTEDDEIEEYIDAIRPVVLAARGRPVQ